MDHLGEIAQHARPDDESGRASDGPIAVGAASAAGGAAAAADAPAECSVLGIDVGGTRTKVGAFALDGSLVGTRAFDSPRVVSDGSHAQLAREFGPLLGRAGVDASAVAAVGLAVPGAVAAEESLELCPNIDLDLQSYQAFLRTAFPQARIAVLNDADAAALGDRWRGTSRESGNGNVVFVTLGTGVGSGILLGGRLLSGAHGAAGEIGHLCVDPRDDEPCSCGKTGCLERYASATGLVRQAREEFVARAAQADRAAAPPSGVVPVVAADSLARAAEAFPDARAVLDAAVRRDPAARAALARFSDALGFGLAQMACLVDPDVFVLGGGLSEQSDLFLDAVRSRYRAFAVSVCRDTPIVASSLGNECGLYGAAFRAYEELAAADPGCAAYRDALH